MLRYYPKGVFTILLIHDCNSLLTVNKICGWQILLYLILHMKHIAKARSWVHI